MSTNEKGMSQRRTFTVHDIATILGIRPEKMRVISLTEAR